MAAAAAERRAILVAEDADSEVTQLLRQSGEVALQSGGKLAAHFELAAGVGCIVITATSILEDMPALEALLLRVKKKYPHPFAIIHNAPLHVVRFLHLQVAAASLGVAVLPARDNEQAARLLARLCNTKKMIGSASVKENEAIAPLRDDDAVSVAAELPGVSPALAVKLLDHFGSLSALGSASASQLQEVPKVGAARAQQLAQFLSGDAHRTSLSS